MAANALPPIIRIRTGNSQVYLIKNGHRSILVDAGLAKTPRYILAEAASVGVQPPDIALIVVTHAHYDHVGGLHTLSQVTGGDILAHPYEAGCMEKGFSPFPKGTNMLGRTVAALGKRLAKYYSSFHPVIATIQVSESYDLEPYGLQGFILPTPGHTAGSLSLILNDDVAIVGDSAFGIFPGKVYPPFADDPQTLLSSWEVLLAAGCQTFLPGHGRPISRDSLKACLTRKRLEQSRLAKAIS
jgi:hydroxyacylglutathione hydrolase